MVKIKIDNKDIEAKEGSTVLRTALENGIYIPHYCYHPALSVSGNCRMCAVEVEGMPKLEISCNLGVREGMVVKTDTEKVKKMRESVLEFLLINHPLDCPTCDQAGECYLQDYHFEYSGKPSRFKEEKNRKPKVVDLGPHVMLDDERCVLCTRCVRFCNEISKSNELTVSRRGDKSFITTAPGLRLDNPYSLNTVDLCPVGALTSKEFRFKKRAWFLESAPSICPGCSNGCKMFIDHEKGVMYRWRPQASISMSEWFKGKTADYLSASDSPVSGFMCNDGRLSYKDWQNERLKSCQARSSVGLVSIGTKDALTKISSALSGCEGGDVVGLVSAQCSCEEIDSLKSFLKEKIGTDKIYKIARGSGDSVDDNILLKADKNPNSKYLEDVEPISDKLQGKVLIITDSVSKDDWMKIISFNWETVIQITHSKSLVVSEADIVLPRATFAETSGSFVNYEGVRQNFEKAFDPKGETKSVSKWIELLNG